MARPVEATFYNLYNGNETAWITASFKCDLREVERKFHIKT